MQKGLFIITGTSRGIGEALAANLLAAGNIVLGVARGHSQRLHHENYTHLTFDLTETARVGEIVEQAQTLAAGDDLGLTCLVHNASLLEPVGLLQICDTEEIHRHLLIGLVTPAALTARFVQAFGGAAGRRKVVFISSGAAFRPLPGEATYCTAKAGLHMLAQSLGEEQKGVQDAVEVVSFGPGMVDTGMQAAIRAKTSEELPIVGLFQQAHAEGRLKDVEKVAVRMAAMLWERQQQGAYVELGEV